MLDDHHAAALTAAAIEDAQTDCALGHRTSLQFMEAMYRTRTLEDAAWKLYLQVYAREIAAATTPAPPAHAERAEARGAYTSATTIPTACTIPPTAAKT